MAAGGRMVAAEAPSRDTRHKAAAASSCSRGLGPEFDRYCCVMPPRNCHECHEESGPPLAVVPTYRPRTQHCAKCSPGLLSIDWSWPWVNILMNTQSGGLWGFDWE